MIPILSREERISDVGFRISGESVNVANAGGWLEAPEIRHPTSEILRRQADFRSGGCTARGLTGDGIVTRLLLSIFPAKYSSRGYRL